MLLAAQQTLPSRALKAERSRRWVPEERRAGFVALPKVTETGTKNGCSPREGQTFPLTSRFPHRAVPADPALGWGLLSWQGGPHRDAAGDPSLRVSARWRWRRRRCRRAPGRSAVCPSGAEGVSRSQGTWRSRLRQRSGVGPSQTGNSVPRGIPALVSVLQHLVPSCASAVWEGARCDGYNVLKALHSGEGYPFAGGAPAPSPCRLSRGCLQPAGLALTFRPAALVSSGTFESG